MLIDYFYPKVFIWCPIAHYSLEIKCPLKPGTLTDEVQKKSAKKPRVVYDLRGNLLLIQQMYLCEQKGMPHPYLSASETILGSLPLAYSQNCFPTLMLYRLACSKELVNVLETQSCKA